MLFLPADSPQPERARNENQYWLDFWETVRTEGFEIL